MGTTTVKLTSIVAAATLALIAGSASAATYTVAGTSDPFLAGAPTGAQIQFDTGDIDTAPAESPVFISVGPTARTFVFSNVAGDANNVPGGGGPGPAGGSLTGSNSFTSIGTSFNELVAAYPTALPFDSLIGVFTGGTGPSGDLGKVFDIGFGGTFTAPAGATGLYLATVDSYQWNNNSGAFTVDVAAVPEPATWAMMLFGLGAIGAGLRMSRRAQPAAV